MRTKFTLLAIFIPMLLCAQQRALVNASAAYLYARPDYESSLETQELMGRVVEISAADRYWRQVKTSQPYTAWVNELALVPCTEAQIEEYEKAPKYIVTALWTRVLDAPRADAGTLSDLVLGDILRDGGRRHGSYGCVVLPDGRKGWVELTSLRQEERWRRECAAMSAEKKAEAVIGLAMGMKGVPYLWGGMSPKGMDCSGLVRLCFLMADVSLPRNASQQYAAGRDIPLEGEGMMEKLSAVRRGDLLFFGSVREDGSVALTHVGLYLGGGRMIHSSQLVRVNSLCPDAPDCYENAHRLLRACRILE